ncbi:MAG: preprotein translocase subunit SecE [Actinobacteria bacterium]|nr:preprotein translocase subunit SecE [Actinomycetota bacterium]MCL5045308.1 preprotein translocase subunit SecE [Actinomycetota bacterium]
MNRKGILQGATRFLREVRSELRKVLWPNRRETVVFTSVVIVAVLIVAAAIAVMDGVFTELLKLVLK